MDRDLRVVLSLVLAVSATACGGASDTPQGPDADPDWTLVWSDDFDGSVLDASKWSVQVGDGCDIALCGWGNGELQWYQADNIEVADGLLTITARIEEAGGKDYTSARIRSLGKGDFLYGRIEARAKLPLGQGMWPAIWMLPTDEAYGGWAASGEIDIVELVGHEPSRVHGTLHYGGQFPANRNSGDHFDLSSGTFADDFHVFTVEWEEGEIRWYVDGTLYQTQTEWNTTAAPFPAPFDQSFHLLMNVAVGGTWPGNPDITTPLPQTMQVDYVRVYQLQ